jgi:PAS domain S-box-containing protein
MKPPKRAAGSRGARASDWATQYFKPLVESSLDIITVVTATGIILYESPSVERILGYRPEERVGKSLFEFLHPDDVSHISEACTQVIGTTDPLPLKEWRVRHREGLWRTFEGVSRNLLDDPVVAGAIICSHDITERKRVEQALRQSLERFTKAFHAGPAAMCITRSVDGLCLDANDQFLKLYGYQREEVIGRTTLELNLWADPDDRERIGQRLQDSQGSVRDLQVMMRTKSGEIREVLLSIEWIELEDELCALSMAHDLTEHKRAEVELKQLAEERRILASRVLDAQEQERKRLARDLHDDLGQNLTALKLESDWVASHASEAELIRGFAARLSAKLDESIDLLRALSFGLRPSVLDDLGIGPALESLVAMTGKRSRMQCEALISSKIQGMPREIATAVYRIAQEALTNALRHSGASKVRVTSRKLGNSVILRVEDNGKGISEAQLNDPKSLGIAGMRERTHLLEGELTITPRRGGGTIVTARIPWRP